MHESLVFFYSTSIHKYNEHKVFSFNMTATLCPHLVQEYFERVSDILTTYRPQILKQVNYDKITENLVLRGALRPEEHERIFQCADKEGQVSQLLVVIQNRMWGLENLLAAFMEEHISPWLTQRMFQSYMEHLVTPMKKQRDTQICQCVQISNSVLYRGWVKALKSLDSWILNAGTTLGFMKQSLYPSDSLNLLAFVNDMLSEYTGGDSASSEDLVPYGFAPNAVGEVQVAELEEDDINDLICLSETLSIAYHSKENEAYLVTSGNNSSSEAPKEAPLSVIMESATHTKPPSPPPSKKVVQRKVLRRPSQSSTKRRRSTDDTPVPPVPQVDTKSGSNEKLSKQREFIDRLSAPKSSPTSKNAPVRLRHSNSVESKALSQRPKSAEFHRSLSVSQSSSSNTTTTSSHPSKSEKIAASGKASGFVRAKSALPKSPKSRITNKSAKPTGITKPNLKSDKGNNQEDSGVDNENEQSLAKEDSKSDAETSPKRLPIDLDMSDYQSDEYEELTDDASSVMSSLFLKNTILSPRGSSDEEKSRNFDYYQLSYNDFASDEGEY